MNIDAEKLKPFLARQQEQYLKDTFRITPCHSNRASSVGHPCARFLTYSRTHWNQRQIPDVYLMSIFRLGWDLEEIVFRWLKERLQLQIIQPKNRDSSWAQYQLTGHLDCYCEEIAGLWVPWEIKGVSAGTWDTVSTWEEMKRSKRHWIKKWVGQLPCYLVMEEKPYGRFVLFQKESGLLKDLVVILDENLQLVEDIIKRLEIVNRHVAAGTLPDRFYEPGPPSETCEGCDFGHLCLPGSSYDEALKLMNDPQVLALLVEEQELKETIKVVAPETKRLLAIGEQLKKFFEGKPKVLIGDFLVEGGVINKKAMDATSYWKRSVKRIGQGGP